jgi:hypothetical protein
MYYLVHVGLMIPMGPRDAHDSGSGAQEKLCVRDMALETSRQLSGVCVSLKKGRSQMEL